MTTPTTSSEMRQPTLRQTISPANLAEVERPVAEARGMPNAAYTDPRFHDFEREYVLGTTWAALAFCADHAQPGKVTPMDFMGLPLLIACDQQGELAVFHNVCSHRGMRLVTETKKTNGLVVCPYHAWTYDLAGNLKATPHIGGVGNNQTPDFCRERHGLKPVRSHCWMGMLFINLSGDAPPFDQHIAPLTKRYAPYLGEQGEAMMVQSQSDSGLSITAQCNWKLAIENYLEAYHLPWIHPSLNSYSPLEKHYCMLISDDFAGQGSTTFNPVLDGKTNLPVFPAWPQAKHKIAEYPTFYPNLLLGYQVNHFYGIIIYPLANNRVREEVRFFYVGEGASAKQHLPNRQSNLNAWEKVFTEDIIAVEGMQQGRQSPGFRGGVFSSTMDTPTHHFHQWVARKYRRAYQTMDVASNTNKTRNQQSNGKVGNGKTENGKARTNGAS